MHPIAALLSHDASQRALLGSRLDDPVRDDTPGRMARARRALARRRAPERPSPHPAAQHCPPRPRSASRA